MSKRLIMNKDKMKGFEDFLFENNNELCRFLSNVDGVHVWNRFSAIVVRLREVIEYCESQRMRLTGKPNIDRYIFSEWILYLSQICDYIDGIYEIFGQSFKQNYEEEILSAKFNNSDARCTQNDVYFLEYIRSLAIIHPTNTSRHIKRGYQIDAQSCMYIDPPKVLNNFLGKGKEVLRRPKIGKIDQCFSMRVSPLSVKDLSEATKKIHEYYSDSIHENLITEEEIRLAIMQEAVGMDQYIFIHPKELALFFDNLSKYIEKAEIVMNEALLNSRSN